LNSKLTGESGRINIDPATAFNVASWNTISAGKDASIAMEGMGISVRSATNTFTEVLAGVSINITGMPTDADEVINVTAQRDTDTLASRVSAMVDTANAAIGTVKSQSTYNATTKVVGVLMGELAARRVQTDLRSAFTTPVEADGRTLLALDFGVTLQKDGTLKFDKAKFVDAYNKDPSAVQRLFFADDPASEDPGIVERLKKVYTSATDFEKGYLTTSVEMKTRNVTSLNKQVDHMESRLLMRERTLRAQFSNLNTALGNLENQRNWILGQLGGMV
jgi:flagellar hook-associated protein 2